MDCSIIFYRKVFAGTATSSLALVIYPNLNKEATLPLQFVAIIAKEQNAAG
jgi:hypothetical protein